MTRIPRWLRRRLATAEVVRLQPGDRLLISVEGSLTMDQAAVAKARLEAFFGVPVAVSNAAPTATVIREEGWR